MPFCCLAPDRASPSSAPSSSWRNTVSTAQACITLWSLPDSCSQDWESSLFFTRVSFQAGSSGTGFGMEHAGTVLVHARWTLLTTVVRAGSPAWSSPRLAFMPDQV